MATIFCISTLCAQTILTKFLICAQTNLPHSAPLISIQEEYFTQLRQALEHTQEVPLTEEARTELRVFRLRNAINSSAHLAALKKLGWTVDEYEVRHRNDSFLFVVYFWTAFGVLPAGSYW